MPAPSAIIRHSHPPPSRGAARGFPQFLGRKETEIMQRLFRLAVTLALVGALTSFSLARSGEKFDVTGEWQFTVELSAGTGSPTFTFQQDGEKLTGTYKGQLGEAPLTGTVKGNAISFSFKVSGAFEGTATYTGTIESENSMKGSAEYGDAATGTWTAKRSK
jgi:hypothetical protein